MVTTLTANANGIPDHFSRASIVSNSKIITKESSRANKTVSSSFLHSTKNSVALVSEFDIFQPSRDPSPEPLDSDSTFNSVSEVISPSSLNTDGHVMPVSIPHVFKCEQGLRGFYESFCSTHLIFVCGDASVFQDLPRPRFSVPSPGVISSI